MFTFDTFDTSYTFYILHFIHLCTYIVGYVLSTMCMTSGPHMCGLRVFGFWPTGKPLVQVVNVFNTSFGDKCDCATEQPLCLRSWLSLRSFVIADCQSQNPVHQQSTGCQLEVWPTVDHHQVVTVNSLLCGFLCPLYQIHPKLSYSTSCSSSRNVPVASTVCEVPFY